MSWGQHHILRLALAPASTRHPSCSLGWLLALEGTGITYFTGGETEGRRDPAMVSTVGTRTHVSRLYRIAGPDEGQMCETGPGSWRLLRPATAQPLPRKGPVAYFGDEVAGLQV